MLVRLQTFKHVTVFRLLSQNHRIHAQSYKYLSLNVFNECQTVDEIMNILWHPSNALDDSAYRNAIKRCNDLRDYQSALRIFHLMEQNDTIQTVETFNALIECLCDCDRTELAFKYFENMTHPSMDTFILILSSCNKRASSTKIAEKVWKKLIFDFEMEPNVQMCNLMISIYVRSGNISKAEIIWKHLKNHKNANSESCAEMIYCYALNKDKEKLIEILDFMQSNELTMDRHHYVGIIKYFVSINNLQGALLIFDEMETNQIAMNEQLLCHLASIYLRCKQPINSIKALAQKYENLFEQSRNLQGLLFEACLIEFEGDRAQIAVIFNRMMTEKKLSEYWTKHSDSWWIDLHGTWRRSKMTQFLLQYVFESEWKRVERMIDLKQDIVILCGRGVHSDPRFCGKTKAVAQRVLLSFNPPIRSSIYSKYSECIVLNRQDVINCLQQNHN